MSLFLLNNIIFKGVVTEGGVFYEFLDKKEHFA